MVASRLERSYRLSPLRAIHTSSTFNASNNCETAQEASEPSCPPARTARSYGARLRTINRNDLVIFDHDDPDVRVSPDIHSPSNSCEATGTSIMRGTGKLLQATKRHAVCENPAASTWDSMGSTSSNKGIFSMSGSRHLSSSSRSTNGLPHVRSISRTAQCAGWSFRYAELLGPSSITHEDINSSNPEAPSPELHDLFADLCGEDRGMVSEHTHRLATPLEHSSKFEKQRSDHSSHSHEGHGHASHGAGGGDGEKPRVKRSVFLAKQARDWRVERMETKVVDKKLLSRKAMRRAAINHTGTCRRQVNAAVKIMQARRPDHMRKMLRAYDSTGLRCFKGVEVKMLDAYEVEEFSGRVGLDEHDVQTLFGAYQRYDNDGSGALGCHEVHRLLADLGLQPRTLEEKSEVNEVLSKYEDQDIEFEEFLNLVKTIRDRLRAVQHDMCVRLFNRADEDGSGILDMSEVMELLGKALCLAPRNDDEDFEVKKIFASCDEDGDGSVGFEEFQEFVQRVRMKILTLRREEEMHIAKAYKLDDYLVDEFQMDLPFMWRVFCLYDHRKTESIDKVDLVPLLMDLGIAPSRRSIDLTSHQRWGAVQAVIGGRTSWEETIAFKSLLSLIHDIRAICKQCFADELWSRFRNSGDAEQLVGRAEIYRVLEDFQMLPRSRAEQQEITTVIDRLDTDGSGTFDATEFQEFFQRLSEYVLQNERRREVQAVRAIGFSEEQVTLLRRRYCQLGPEGCDRVTMLESARSMKTLPDLFSFPADRIDEEKIACLIGSARLCDDLCIDFSVFAQMAKSVLRDPEEVLVDDEMPGREEDHPALPSKPAAETGSSPGVNMSQSGASDAAGADGGGGSGGSGDGGRAGNSRKGKGFGRRHSTHRGLQ